MPRVYSLADADRDFAALRRSGAGAEAESVAFARIVCELTSGMTDIEFAGHREMIHFVFSAFCQLRESLCFGCRPEADKDVRKAVHQFGAELCAQLPPLTRDVACSIAPQ